MTPSLQIDRSELKQALKSISRLLHVDGKAEAGLSFNDGTMYFEMPGMRIGAAAKGEWNGKARIEASFLKALACVPPSHNPVLFSIVNGKLNVHGSVVSCAWEADTGIQISLPLNPTNSMILSAAYHYTPDDIEKSGLKEIVSDAEKKRDSNIRAAEYKLKDYSVTRAELRFLVDEKMRSTLIP